MFVCLCDLDYALVCQIACCLQDVGMEALDVFVCEQARRESST